MNMSAIIGGGVLGRHIISHLSSCTPEKTWHIFDDIALSTSTSEFIHSFNQYPCKEFSKFNFYIGLGYNHLKLRLKIINEIKAMHRAVPSFVHSSSHRDPTAEIEDGSIVFPMCNIDKNVSIGKGVILHNSVTISHDCVIGDSSYLSPGVILCGNVTIGPYSFIGAGSVISNGIRIGSGVKIGLGSVVTKNVGDETSAIGNPLRILKKDLKII